MLKTKLKKFMAIGLATTMVWGGVLTTPAFVSAKETLTENPTKYRYRVYVQNIKGSDGADFGEFMPGEEIVLSVPEKEKGKKLKNIVHVSENNGTQVEIVGNKVTIHPSDLEYEAIGLAKNSKRIGRFGLVYSDPRKEAAVCDLKVTLDNQGKITEISEVKGNKGGCYHGLSSERAKYDKFFKNPDKFVQSFIGKNYQQVLAMNMRHRRSKDAPENFSSSADFAKDVGYSNGKFPDASLFYFLGAAMKNAVLDAMLKDGLQEISTEGLKELTIKKQIHSSDCNHYLHLLVNKYGRVVSIWDHTREDQAPSDGGIVNAGNEKAIKTFREGLGYDRFIGLNKDEIERLDMSRPTKFNNSDAISGATENCYSFQDAIVQKLSAETFEPEPEPEINAAGTYEGHGQSNKKSVVVHEGSDKISTEYIVLNLEKEDDTSVVEEGKTVRIKNGDVAYETIGKYMEGEKVYISCISKNKAKQDFSGWVVESGGVTIDEPDSRNTYFTMGNENVVIKSTYGVPKPAVFSSGKVKDETPNQIDVTMDKELVDVSETAENKDDFSVKVENKPAEIEKYAISGNKLTLKLNNPVKAGDSVVLTYTDNNQILKTKNGGAAVANFTKAISNVVVPKDVTLNFVTAEINEDAPTDIVLTVTEILETNNDLPVGEFEVTLGSDVKAIEKVSSAGNKIVIKLNEAADGSWKDIKVAYKGTESLKSDGKPVKPFSKLITNKIPPAKILPIEILIEKYNPSKIVLKYKEALVTVPADTVDNIVDFKVKKNGEVANILSYKISRGISSYDVELVLETKATKDDEFRISYDNVHKVIKTTDDKVVDKIDERLVTNQVSGKYVVTLKTLDGYVDLGSFEKGQTVNIEAPVIANKTFKEWEVITGDVEVADKNASKTTFIMKEKAVVIQPIYKEIEKARLNFDKAEINKENKKVIVLTCDKNLKDANGLEISDFKVMVGSDEKDVEKVSSKDKKITITLKSEANKDWKNIVVKYTAVSSSLMTEDGKAVEVFNQVVTNNIKEENSSSTNSGSKKEKNTTPTGKGASRAPAAGQTKPNEQTQQAEQQQKEIAAAQAEITKAVKEVAQNIADKEQAKQVDKLLENKPVTEKKEALKALTVETKEKLAVAVLPKYTDVKKDTWYSKDLAVVMSMGLVKGTSAKTVSPEKNVTGKEMMAMLVRSMGKEVKQSADSNWYDSYKKEAAALKLDEGIKFDVSKYLSRAEVAAMMYNYVKLNEKTLEKVDPNVLAQVKDMADIPAEYKEAVAYMYQKGLLKGYEDGSFMPNKSLTRVEAVIILARLLTI